MAKSPLMQFDGKRWRNWECYNAYKNSKGIFVGGGSSLNYINTSKLKGPGKTVVGVNTTYPTVVPDIWVGMDQPECYDSRVFFEAFPKIMRGGYQNHKFLGKKLWEYPNSYFAGIKRTSKREDIFYQSESDASFYIWENNVFVTTMNMMLHMGFKEIYFAGVDFSMENGSYFHGKQLEGKYYDWNKSLYATLYKYLEWLHSTCKMAGITLKSISPNSPINNFMPYISLEELNSSIELPTYSEFLHCCELDDRNTSKK